MAPFFQRADEHRVNALNAKHSPSSLSERHHFHHQLDALYLQEFYANDWVAAATMFDLFLQSTIQTCQQIFRTYQGEQFQLFQQLVHKVRASFKMVGLGQLDSLLEQLEQAEESQLLSNHCKQLIKQFQRAIKQYLPIIRTEAQRLNALL